MPLRIVIMNELEGNDKKNNGIAMSIVLVKIRPSNRCNMFVQTYIMNWFFVISFEEVLKLIVNYTNMMQSPL